MTEFNPGGITDTFDERDLPYEAFVGYADYVDLPDFYDVEATYGPISQKNQEQTLSCGGQAVSYYAELLNVIDEGFVEFSPRSIYAFTHLPDGGSITRDSILRLVNSGIAPEDRFLSQPMTEGHMQDQTGWTADISKLALRYKGKIATTMTDRTNFDLFKTAIYQGHGVVSGVNLSSGGWYSSPIRPPKDGEKIVGHIMYFKGWGTDDHGDFIIAKDSYPSGDKKLYRDYFEASMVHSAWTVIDLPNEGETMEKYWPQANSIIVGLGGANNSPDATALAKALRLGEQPTVNTILKKYQTTGSSNADIKLNEIDVIIHKP